MQSRMLAHLITPGLVSLPILLLFLFPCPETTTQLDSTSRLYNTGKLPVHTMSRYALAPCSLGSSLSMIAIFTRKTQ
jgi:hypothetical protein